MFTTIPTLRAMAVSSLLAGLALTAAAQSATIDVSTSNPAWQASYAGGSGPAFRYPCPIHTCISISSTGFGDGVFVGGGTAAQFDGVWSGTLDFVLPAGGRAVRMELTLHGADDRATLYLNGKPLLTQFLVYSGSSISYVAEDPSLFVIGGRNQLAVRVANNPNHPSGPGLPLQFVGDGTAFSMSGSVSSAP